MLILKFFKKYQSAQNVQVGAAPGSVRIKTSDVLSYLKRSIISGRKSQQIHICIF